MKNYALRTNSSVGTKLRDARGNCFHMNGVELDLYGEHPLFERSFLNIPNFPTVALVGIWSTSRDRCQWRRIT
jgi:hypothetical protein